jgi:hypothetical protein
MVAGPFSLVWSSFGKTGPPHRTHRSCHDLDADDLAEAILAHLKGFS